MPVELEERTTSGITLLFKYETAPYLDPGNTRSNIAVSEFSLEGDSLEFVINNDGTKHQNLKDFSSFELV